MILGLPCLELHNPQISWSEKQLTHWSLFQSHCFQTPQLTITSTAIESPECRNPSKILAEYQDLTEVFSKTKASGLPPHCNYDCAILLLPGTTPSRSQIYPLLVAERKVMEEYIQEALQ